MTVGTYEEGRKFLDMCAELGLTVQSVGRFVPFSNGKNGTGSFADAVFKNGRFNPDYLEDELKLMRWDLPTREELERMIGGDPS